MWWAPLLNNIVALLGNGGGAANSYESIATVTVGAGGSSSIAFTSIPSTYKHLQIRGIGRSTAAGSTQNIVLTFNSSTSTNNATHYLQGNGSAVAAGAITSNNWIYFAGNMPAASASANIFGVTVADVLDYADNNKNKTIRSLGGADQNGSGAVELLSGVVMSTTAISSITLSASFAQYSQFALYGVKG